MTRIPPGPRAPFPDLSACPDDCGEVVARWEAVLERAPRLRPWLDQMIRQKRAVLRESVHGSIEQALWWELTRWLRQFEALPHFAVSALAVTLEDAPAAAKPPPEPPPPPAAASPERAASEAEAMLADPAFALAFHCVDTRLRPALQGPLPAYAWFGLLHSSAAQQALLTPEVAVGLVLRLLSAEWSRLPGAVRKAALRLFHATAADLKAGDRIEQLCAVLPPGWSLRPAGAPAFLAAAAQARAAMSLACGLCARIAAAAGPTRCGGLAVLQLEKSAPASPAELAELCETARKFRRMTGFQRLLALL